MSWGVSVPGDDDQVMYVWFDALTNYISTLGWPNETGDFEKYWVHGTPVQYCGKDNTRFQGAMWQAMLMSADLPNSNKIIVNGFITGDGGIKMSKSLGNVVNPYDIVAEYGTDALRYFLLREVSSFEDSPFTMERFKDAYNAGLANGIGNLTSRIMKMATTNIDTPIEVSYSPFDEKFVEHMESFDIQKASDVVFAWVGELDKEIQTTEPFKLIKTDPEKAKEIIVGLVKKLAYISLHLEPLLPETAQKIIDLIIKHQNPETPLFARKD
jgi:methionyl-tRNA synthetase